MSENETQGAPAPVSVTIESDVAVIRLDDGKANALSFAVLEALNAALDRAESEAKAVALIGRPGRFSAGFDLSVMTGPDPAAARDLLGTGAHLALRLFNFPMPVVLGVTGHALAMGGILCCTADWRVGVDGPFKLGLNEVGIGMPVPVFGVELCRTRLTPKWFTPALQCARVLTPAEAAEAGFLDEVVEAESLEARVLEAAAGWAASVNPGAFRMTRANMRGQVDAFVRESLVADLGAFNVDG